MSILFVGNSESSVFFLEKSGIDVQKVFHTRKPSIELTEFTKKRGLDLLKLDELAPNADDVIILYECNKIFSLNDLERGKWINIHAGTLPFWRGFNANSWAILNDFPTVGISIHEVTERLDDGPILKVFTERNDLVATYFELKQVLIERVALNFKDLLSTYLNGKLQPTPQEVDRKQIRYCSRLKAEDGILKSFNHESRYIFNLFRVFFQKGESNFFLRVKGNLLKVLDMEVQPVFYNGPTGRLLMMEDGKCLIKTLDSAIWCRFESEDHALLKNILS